MPRVERPPGRIRAELLRRRRAFGRTRPGRAVKRLLGREIRIPILTDPDPTRLIAFPGEQNLSSELRDTAILERAVAQRSRMRTPAECVRPIREADEVQASAASSSPIVNVVLVSHCNFKGNSAFHVYAIAMELHQRGLSPVIAVPDEPESVDDIGRPPFPVLTYDEALGDALRFPDGRGPDLVHAFTPREIVRALTTDLVRTHDCRYVVHLEDNEEAVLSGEHGGVSVAALKELPAPVLDRVVRPRQADPLRTTRFLQQAAGITVLVERLLEFVPPGVRAAIVPAGFDEAVLTPRRPREEVRTELRLEPSDIVIVYPGNIHMVNMKEMRSLYEAVAEVRRAGQSVVLVKTGWGSTQTVTFPALGAGVRDLGWVTRETVAELLAAADILVQPGGPSPFNDYRFPSKLPEFLASGRPVVLPRTNLGLLLRDGEEALLLARGDAPEIAAAVSRLGADPALRARLGEAGRAFALRELRWSKSVDRVQELYREVARSGVSPPPSWALDGSDPPVKLVALVPAVPSAAEAELARSHGIYGFCLDASAPSEPARDFRFCFQVSDGVEREIAMALSDPLYIRIEGTPFLALTDAADPTSWREAIVHESGSEGRLGRIVTADAYANLASARETDGGAVLEYEAMLADDPNYAVGLRKLVLRALLLREIDEPLVFIDATKLWPDRERRSQWLAATRAGLRDGLQQYYASRSLKLTNAEVDQMARAS